MVKPHYSRTISLLKTIFFKQRMLKKGRVFYLTYWIKKMIKFSSKPFEIKGVIV